MVKKKKKKKKGESSSLFFVCVYMYVCIRVCISQVL